MKGCIAVPFRVALGSFRSSLVTALGSLQECHVYRFDDEKGTVDISCPISTFFCTHLICCVQNLRSQTTISCTLPPIKARDWNPFLMIVWERATLVPYRQSSVNSTLTLAHERVGCKLPVRGCITIPWIGLSPQSRCVGRELHPARQMLSNCLCQVLRSQTFVCNGWNESILASYSATTHLLWDGRIATPHIPTTEQGLCQHHFRDEFSCPVLERRATRIYRTFQVYLCA